MLIIWIVIAAAAVVLLVKFRAVLELRKQDGRGYADGDAGERRAETEMDAAYAQTEAESQNAQGMAEENTSLWP